MDRKVPEFPLNLLPCQYCLEYPPAKLTILKVQDGVGSTEIALRTDSARERTGYGQEQNFKGNNVSLWGVFLGI